MPTESPSTTLDNNHRFTVDVKSINSSDRLRKDLGDITELAESIKTLGLLQPIVIKLDGTLIAGGRRLTAMRSLGWTDIPVTYFEVADEVTLRILEVEENVRRKPMSWQERVCAIALVHSKQSLTKALKSERWTLAATGELLGMSTSNISYALTLADHINRGDKGVIGCDGMWDAIHLLAKRYAEESTKLLAKLTIPTVDPAAARKLLSETELDDGDIFSSPTAVGAGGVSGLSDDGELPGVAAAESAIVIPLSNMVIHGDALQVMAGLAESCVDHIITDPPYAIDMANIDQAKDGASVADTAAHHTVEGNRDLLADFLPAAYRVLKANGFCILFADPSMWQALYDRATAVGFKVQRWPLIWHKTHRCMNQMALYNFTKNYEIAIVCRKGNATLITPQESSIYMGATDEATRALKHPFAKPAKLWQWLYQAVTIKGQTVLDPFSGVGSSTLAAVEYGLQPLAVELNEQYHAAQVVNVSEYYTRTLKNVRFV